MTKRKYVGWHKRNDDLNFKFEKALYWSWCAWWKKNTAKTQCRNSRIFLPLRFYVTVFTVAILIWRKFGTFPQLKYTTKIICNTFYNVWMICFDALGFLNLISRKKVVAAEKFTISHCEIESGDTMLKVIAHFSSWCHLRKKEAAAASEESASSVRRRTTSEKEHQKTRWT